MLLDDTTPEALVEYLCEQGSVSYIEGEGQLVDNLSRYSDSQTPNVEALNKIKSDRESYKQQGKTPKECYEDFKHTISYHFSRIKKSDSDFKIFKFLWNKLDIFPVLIAADRRRCIEIREML